MSQTQTILLVEDDELVRTVLSRFLVRGGYFVLEVPDGEEGWRLYQQYVDQIDLVVTDWSVPGIDGETLCRQARTLNPSVKTILVTGDAIEEAELEHAQKLLTKPFSADQLLMTARAVLAGE